MLRPRKEVRWVVDVAVLEASPCRLHVFVTTSRVFGVRWIIVSTRGRCGGFESARLLTVDTVWSLSTVQSVFGFHSRLIVWSGLASKGLSLGI